MIYWLYQSIVKACPYFWMDWLTFANTRHELTRQRIFNDWSIFVRDDLTISFAWSRSNPEAAYFLGANLEAAAFYVNWQRPAKDIKEYLIPWLNNNDSHLNDHVGLDFFSIDQVNEDGDLRFLSEDGRSSYIRNIDIDRAEDAGHLNLVLLPRNNTRKQVEIDILRIKKNIKGFYGEKKLNPYEAFDNTDYLIIKNYVWGSSTLFLRDLKTHGTVPFSSDRALRIRVEKIKKIFSHVNFEKPPKFTELDIATVKKFHPRNAPDLERYL